MRAINYTVDAIVKLLDARGLLPTTVDLADLRTAIASTVRTPVGSLGGEVQEIVESYLTHGVLGDQANHRTLLMQLSSEVASATVRRPQPPSSIQIILNNTVRRLLASLPERRDWLDPEVEKLLRAIVEGSASAESNTDAEGQAAVLDRVASPPTATATVADPAPAAALAEIERLTRELQNQRELVQHWKSKAVLNADYQDARRYRIACDEGARAQIDWTASKTAIDERLDALMAARDAAVSGAPKPG